MTLSGTARRLMIIVDEDAMVDHHPVYTEIVRRAQDAGLAGASVFRGIEGFGRSRRVHTSRILSLAENLPAMVVIVDTAPKISAFVSVLADLHLSGVVAMDDVEVVTAGVQP